MSWAATTASSAERRCDAPEVVHGVGLSTFWAWRFLQRCHDRQTDRQTNSQIYREGDRDRDIEAFLRRCGEPTSICCRNNPGCAVASLCPLCR